MALGPVIKGLIALSTVIGKNFAKIKKMKDTKERAELVKKTDKDLQDLDRQAGNIRLNQSDATKFIDDLEGQRLLSYKTTPTVSVTNYNHSDQNRIKKSNLSC